MAAERLSVALVGAGRMGSVHLDALSRCARAQAVAIVDPAPAARELAERRGLAWLPSVAELAEAEIARGAIVAAPTDLHVVLVTQLAGAGMHVLCEKPCGLEAQDPGVAQAAADAAGVVLQIGYWRRFVPALVALRERIASGALGEVSFVGCHQWDGEPPSEAFRARSGGIAVDMAVHEIDQARWLTGSEATSLWALPAGPARDDPRDPDVALACGRTEAGAGLAISLGRRHPGGDACWTEVIGRRGHERIVFLGGEAGDEPFTAAVAAQADAFAHAAAGGPRRGATAADAAAALAGALEIGAGLSAQAAGAPA